MVDARAAPSAPFSKARRDNKHERWLGMHKLLERYWADGLPIVSNTAKMAA